MKGAQAQEGRMWVSEHTDRTHKPRTGITIKRKREITHIQVINRSRKVAQSRDVDLRLCGWPSPDKNKALVGPLALFKGRAAQTPGQWRMSSGGQGT